MKNRTGLRASIATAAVMSGCLFAGSAMAQASCTIDNWSVPQNAANLNAAGPVDSQPRLVGACSLEVTVDGTPSYVQDDNPDGENSYRARFYVLPGSGFESAGTTIFSTEAFNIVATQSAGGTPSFEIDGTSVAGGAGWNSVEVAWDNSGDFTLTVGYEQEATSGPDAGFMVSVVNSDTGSTGTTLINTAQLGNVNGAGTGTLIFDDFESRRTDPIGRLCAGDTNGDNQRDLTDVFAAFDEFASAGTNPANGVPDIDGNGVVDLSDVFATFDLFAAARGGCS